MQENRVRKAAGEDKLPAPDLDLLQVIPHPQQEGLVAGWNAWVQVVQVALVVHGMIEWGGGGGGGGDRHRELEERFASLGV